MPKRGKGEIPLPEGWEECLDYDGKRFFIDHNTRQTTWVDPRDRWDILGVFSCIVKQAPCMLLFSILSCNYYVFHHRFGLFFLLYSLEIYLYAPLITNMQCMHWQTYPIREVTRELAYFKLHCFDGKLREQDSVQNNNNLSTAIAT